MSTKLAGEGLTVDENGKINLKETGALASYPVGSIYQSTSSTSPAALFGGTWQKIAQNRVLMGASSTHPAGTTVEAGLPNITGVFNRDENYGIITSTNKSSGAFYYGGTNVGRGVTSSDVQGGNLCFDASRSNSIYGASTTVQPAAYYVHIWKRVA